MQSGQLLTPTSDGGSEHTLANIDFLRGLAALAILFWHYQHFYTVAPNTWPAGWSVADQPLYSVFGWAYGSGRLAVLLFWLISGFVFFHVYSARQGATARQYLAARLSRLYPLHLITLLLVAGLQLLSLQLTGQWTIFHNNDSAHFMLHLFMIGVGNSFNMPIWSVTAELMSYAVFFLWLRTVGVGPKRAALYLGFIAAAYAFDHDTPFQCATDFALGGAIQQLTVVQRGRPGLVAGVAGLIAALAVGGWISGLLAAHADNALEFLGFPALLWAAATLEGFGVSAGRFGVTLGSTTYASYLAHTPVQIALILILDRFGARAAVGSPLFLAAYVVGMFALSLVIYARIELPLKIWMRRAILRGLGRPRAAVAALPSAAQ